MSLAESLAGVKSGTVIYDGETLSPDILNFRDL